MHTLTLVILSLISLRYLMVQIEKKEGKETGRILTAMAAIAILFPSVINQPAAGAILVIASLAYWALLIKHLKTFILPPFALALGIVAISIFYSNIG